MKIVNDKEIIDLITHNKLAVPVLTSAPAKVRHRMLTSLLILRPKTFEQIIIAYLLTSEGKQRNAWFLQELQCFCRRFPHDTASPSIESYLQTPQDPAVLSQKDQQLIHTELDSSHSISLLIEDYLKRLKDLHPELWS